MRLPVRTTRPVATRSSPTDGFQQAHLQFDGGDPRGVVDRGGAPGGGVDQGGQDPAVDPAAGVVQVAVMGEGHDGAELLVVADGHPRGRPRSGPGGTALRGRGRGRRGWRSARRGVYESGPPPRREPGWHPPIVSPCPRSPSSEASTSTPPFGCRVCRCPGRPLWGGATPTTPGARAPTRRWRRRAWAGPWRWSAWWATTMPATACWPPSTPPGWARPRCGAVPPWPRAWP